MSESETELLIRLTRDQAIENEQPDERRPKKHRRRRSPKISFNKPDLKRQIAEQATSEEIDKRVDEIIAAHRAFYKYVNNKITPVEPPQKKYNYTPYNTDIDVSDEDTALERLKRFRHKKKDDDNKI